MRDTRYEEDGLLHHNKDAVHQDRDSPYPPSPTSNPFYFSVSISSRPPRIGVPAPRVESVLALPIRGIAGSRPNASYAIIILRVVLRGSHPEHPSTSNLLLLLTARLTSAPSESAWARKRGHFSMVLDGTATASRC